jgi:hypothetical protein
VLRGRISSFEITAFMAQESFIMASWNTLKNRLCIALLLGAASLQAAVAGPILSITATPNPAIVGSTVNVDVSIADIVDLAAYQFTLNFNSALLQVAGPATEGLFLGTGGTTFYDGGTVDNGAGTISFTFGSLIGFIPGVSGGGILAHYSFSVVGAGTSLLSLSDLMFLDSGINDIAVQANDLSLVSAAAPDPSAVPEPAAFWLLGIGLAGLTVARRRKSD